MPKLLTEATSSVTATPVEGKPGKFLIQLIDVGWGSSGYYGQDVLEAAAAAKVWPTGTHMYLDHPTRTEEYDRPERSVRDLAAVLSEDARWDDGLKSLVAEATVFASYRQVLDEMVDDIGISIRAYAESKPGEADGRKGTIVTDLVEGISVDFVTHAGRGGKILQVIESARTATEATANDIRAALQSELVDTYGGEQQWVGVRDFDPDEKWVVFYQCTPDSDELYRIGYSLDSDGVATLTGDPVEVQTVTTYVPVNPAGPDNTTESKEDTMPQIEEARLRQLEEDAGRVQTLESERDAAAQRATTAEAERDEARRTIAESERTTTVSRILGEAREAANGVELDEFQAAGVTARAVFGEDGNVDEAKTREAFDKAIATIAEKHGVGRPRGLGGRVHTPAGGDTVTEAYLDELDAAVFGDATSAATPMTQEV